MMINETARRAYTCFVPRQLTKNTFVSVVRHMPSSPSYSNARSLALPESLEDCQPAVAQIPAPISTGEEIAWIVLNC